MVSRIIDRETVLRAAIVLDDLIDGAFAQCRAQPTFLGGGEVSGD